MNIFFLKSFKIKGWRGTGAVLEGLEGEEADEMVDLVREDEIVIRFIRHDNFKEKIK